MTWWIDGPAPIDSYDLYAMGLRAPRCNGCKLAEYKHRLGDKFLLLSDGVFEYDAEPMNGQSWLVYKGRPVKFLMWGMAYGHSDECYHWSPKHLERRARSAGWLSRRRLRTKTMYHRSAQRKFAGPIRKFWNRLREKASRRV
jgi:hypothetical protein